jgi:endonuclease-3
MELTERALAVHQALLDFYGQPEWRNPLAPLDELVSTILSQNTNDTNRDRAYQSLRARFPTWEDVRDAPEGEVVEAIRTAGLANQKGPRIQAVLREITKQRGALNLDFLGDYSSDEAQDWLTQFKGVGPKTAAIVLLFSLDKPAFPVDTHIYRVSGRIGLRPPKMSADQAHEHLARLFPPETYYAAHLNIIRLGREICQARRLHCEICPVNQLCDTYAELSQGDVQGDGETDERINPSS